MREDIQSLLADFQFSCQLSYQCLHQTPDAEFLGQLQVFTAEEFDSGNEAINTGLKLIRTALTTLSPPAIAAINDDFAQLFIGPDALKAAPWASVYLTEDQTLWGATTIAVKNFYRQCGLEIDTGTRESEDHLGLMFAFMADRFAQMSAATEGDLETEMALLQTFLSEHVLTWAPRFLDIMANNASTDFYRGISALSKGCLEQLAELTGAEYRIIRLYR